MSEVIEVTDDFIRVGTEKRPAPFSDHFIADWTFMGGGVAHEGVWESEPWSPERIKRHKRRNLLRRLTLRKARPDYTVTVYGVTVLDRTASR